LKIPIKNFINQEKNMSQIKDTISNLFSKNKKKNNGVSSEIENESGIIEKPDPDAEAEDKTKTEGVHETEVQNAFTAQEDLDTDPEWEKRVLCSDGNCIGVIGPDGLCKECAKPYDGDQQTYYHDDTEQEISDAQTPDEELISDEQDFFSENPEEVKKACDDSITEPGSDSDEEWDNRTLCSDGNCIGVIGADGCCKECGKPYEE
jgi:hypothetical protein